MSRILPDATKLTTNQARAAQLVAEDTLTDDAISKECGIGRATLTRWKHLPLFIERRESIEAELAAAILEVGIASRKARVAALEDRWHRMRGIIDERAASDPPGKAEDVPGWSSGLLTHSTKGVGKGDSFHLEDVYAVDSALLAEMRAHERQAAQELGQWLDKAELASSNDSPLMVEIIRHVPDLGIGPRRLPEG